MLGAIIGDIIGSPYEHRNHKSTDFALFSDRSRFTDDTVLTVAVADVILHGKDYAETLGEHFSGYPNAGARQVSGALTDVGINDNFMKELAVTRRA